MMTNCRRSGRLRDQVQRKCWCANRQDWRTPLKETQPPFSLARPCHWGQLRNPSLNHVPTIRRIMIAGSVWGRQKEGCICVAGYTARILEEYCASNSISYEQTARQQGASQVVYINACTYALSVLKPHMHHDLGSIILLLTALDR
jgi:hypothetical protein